MEGAEWGVAAASAASLAALVACSDSTSNSPPAEVEGRWVVIATLEDVDGGNCVVKGVVDIVQSGGGFDAGFANTSLYCLTPRSHTTTSTV